MSFQLIEFVAIEKQYEQYNGRLAITLGWELNFSEPSRDRYTIITPLKKGEYILRDGTREVSCNSNTIIFDHYTWGSRQAFDTTDMVKFTEHVSIKPPASRKNKWGDRPVYKWGSGKWYIDHYERED